MHGGHSKPSIGVQCHGSVTAEWQEPEPTGNVDVACQAARKRCDRHRELRPRATPRSRPARRHSLPFAAPRETVEARTVRRAPSAGLEWKTVAANGRE